MILLLLSGCEKDPLNEPCAGNCITITGDITTELNPALPAAGVKLKLSWGRPSVSFFGSPHRDIAVTTSDKAGHYAFKFTPKSHELEGGGYEIEISKKNYFSNRASFYDITRGDTVVNQDFHIARKGMVRVKILNFPVNSLHDSINIATSYSSYPVPWTGTVNYDLKGQALSPIAFNVLEFTSEVAANQYTYFNILRIKNGRKQFEKDSIFNKAGQENSYLYNY